VQVGGTSVVPALFAGELHFTTVLSAVGANAAQGGETRIVQFHSVKLQHVLSVRPEITSLQQLAGKRIAVQNLGTLTAIEARRIAEHFNVPDVAIIAVGSDLERIAAMEAGAADANVAAIPMNIVAEQRGFPTLLRISTFLEIPQAGFGTSLAHLRDRTDLVTRSLRAAARALPLITAQPDVVTSTIAEFMELSPQDAARAYEMVADTFSPNGVPSDVQLAAYLDVLRTTSQLANDVPDDQVSDFSIARRVAAELGLPNP
jgi:ABC-type nitrate/sulfonate/bicarbonate transport system substrate-binding protein